MNLRAIIIERERHIYERLKRILSAYCPEIDLLASVGQAAFVRELIQQQQPEIVFLETGWLDANGEALLKSYSNRSFDWIFLSKDDRYAVKAFRYNAIDYLLQPIDFRFLKEAIHRVEIKRSPNTFSPILPNNTGQALAIERIALPDYDGMVMIDLEAIVYCEVEQNEVIVHLSDGQQKRARKSLKYFEDRLCHTHFFRISRSCIINIHYLKEYIRTRKGEVLLENGTILHLSKDKKKPFMKQIIMQNQQR